MSWCTVLTCEKSLLLGRGASACDAERLIETGVLIRDQSSRAVYLTEEDLLEFEQWFPT
ncbi:hypothetical protein [Paenibacillus arenosi]|uniref:Uncharacterized protein n=1 Tax=Paenibacillus arenosi TaxID=2774142 RepID=A0ABR9B2X8_9BACL|nr:hypothetical protein [Paenibacillus arenosi]MBD8500728.1 hypothetical protein [Paenibacillus arenosi]